MEGNFSRDKAEKDALVLSTLALSYIEFEVFVHPSIVKDLAVTQLSIHHETNSGSLQQA